MAGPRSRKQTTKRVKARVLIVEARYYEDVAEALLKGAEKALRAAGASIERITVPGALEIPAAIAMAMEAGERGGKPFDAAVALGCVIRGETFHFEIVATQSARALMELAVAYRFPIGNGILTVETKPQALIRARIGEGDKGGEAARAALALLSVRRKFGRGK